MSWVLIRSRPDPLPHSRPTPIPCPFPFLVSLTGGGYHLSPLSPRALGSCLPDRRAPLAEHLYRTCIHLQLMCWPSSTAFILFIALSIEPNRSERRGRRGYNKLESASWRLLQSKG